MTRRLALTGIAVLASLTLATGCTTTKGGQPGATTPAEKPATELLNDAVAKTKGQSFKFTLTYGELIKGDGAQDGNGTSGESNMTITVPEAGITMKANVRLVAEDLYMKLDMGPLTQTIPGLGNLGDKWMHVDKSKISNSGLAGGLTPGGDQVAAESFLKGVVSAEKVSATEIKGTMDLTKSAAGMFDAEDVKDFGDAAKNVPFTTTLDSEGRIVKLVMNMPKTTELPAMDMITLYSDYGAAVNIAKPAAAETVEAPEMIYQFLQ